MNQHVLFSHGHLAASISMAGEEAKDLVPHEKGPGSHALVLYIYTLSIARFCSAMENYPCKQLQCFVV